MKHSIEKKVGQLLWVGVPGTKTDKAYTAGLARMGVGGVIYFSHNFESGAQILEMTNALQKAVSFDALDSLPLWIGVDHEGGRVQRFKKEFTIFPPAARWGDLNSPKTCFEAGYVMGAELRSVGIQVNFSPVLDVLQDKDNQAIGDRAFSDQADVVASCGSATVRGLLKAGVMSVAKHFPGHGSVRVDSHVDLPVCTKSIEELEAVDWIPFRRALRSRVEGIMTAHILFPKLDPDRPATLSRKILQDQLRKGLRFQKLIFSDDLEMGALMKRYSLKEAAFLAVEAGCDQILMCHAYDQVEEVWKHLVDAFESGALPMRRLDESIERIAAAKKEFLLPLKFADPAELAQTLGRSDFLEVSRAIQEKRSLETGPSADSDEK
jgi:beta-N-acetylhexosaminidase